MKINLIKVTSRCVVFELENMGIYNTNGKCKVSVSGFNSFETCKVVNTVNNLKPDTEYTINVECDGEACEETFVTNKEFVTLNVKDFGAYGDGIHDDTLFIQTAIYACPSCSRVLIPKGLYKITSLFLKSDISIELAAGAEIIGNTERESHPYLPSVIQSYDENDEYILGTWEGNPRPMYTGIIMGMCVKNVCIYGEGVINGNSSADNWWNNPKKLNVAYRPRTFFVNACENISLIGITIKNSPSWTIHPYFSKNLEFYDLSIENPEDSPNTDGIDPESCTNVKIIGVKFSLGDDCIAVKSGKIYMGRKYKTPSENIIVRQCLMQDGHGAVTVGSEMAGGVKNLLVENCRFVYTDRGLRIKTRRGRGKDAVIDEITFKNIEMDNVMTPFVINCFYFCDPDGKSEYVQSREPGVVDERTPLIKKLRFEQINAKECHVAAAYFEGLPEKKIEEIVMNDINIEFANDARSDVPAMSLGVNKCSKRGIVASNVSKLVLKKVFISGNEGDKYEFSGIEEVTEL